MNTEIVVLLSDDGLEIGTAPKERVHTADTPLHRAFSCYVFNDKKQILVTKRADIKKVWPGVWTNSTCGHPQPGESDEDAIARRLDYELGMKATVLRCLVKDYRYKTPRLTELLRTRFALSI